jgi:protein associated with RNAse G/E
VRATNFDGTAHWSHPARLIEASAAIVVTETSAGLEVERDGGIFVSPFNTRGHYWPGRWFNVIRLEEPDLDTGSRLAGFYCNIATPTQLDVRVFVEDGLWRYEVWDEDEFEAAREKYGYDDELVGRCRRAVEEVIALIEARAFPFDVAA